MKNELDAKMLLRVFDKIRRHGEHTSEHHALEGVKAYTDFDGYTVFIEDALVKLSFGFHNQYHYNYQDKSQLEAFEKKIAYIDNQY